MKKILFWILFPFVIPQAIKIKKSAVRLNGPTGEKSGVFKKPGGRLFKITGLGDSIIAGIGASNSEKTLTPLISSKFKQKRSFETSWTILGKNGIKIYQIMPEFSEKLKKSKPDLIIISAGINDVTGLCRTKKFKNHIKKIKEFAKNELDSPYIAFSGIPEIKNFPLMPFPLGHVLNLRVKILDNIIKKEISTYPKGIYIPLNLKINKNKFSKDGYHPSEDGYNDYADHALKYILKTVSKD
ncbi:MAG: hypothetical protein CSB21_01900 [Deltaproteobacteria bacterium]|nr:MAG: hypothetical protein CSB21_01900 [Deltaproteobacteria bacterium]